MGPKQVGNDGGVAAGGGSSPDGARPPSAARLREPPRPQNPRTRGPIAHLLQIRPGGRAGDFRWRPPYGGADSAPAIRRNLRQTLRRRRSDADPPRSVTWAAGRVRQSTAPSPSRTPGNAPWPCGATEGDENGLEGGLQPAR